MASRKQSDGMVRALSVHAAGLAADMAEQGYSQLTIQHQVWLFATVSRWLVREGLTLGELSPFTLQRFENYRRQSGGSSRKRSLVAMLRYLRRVGAVPKVPKPLPVGPNEELLERYRAHLVVERGLARSTVAKYEWAARLFLGERPTAGGCVSVDSLDGAAVIRFIQQQCPNRGVGSAKNLVKGLRPLLRYLQMEGLIPALSDAVPTVAGWRGAYLPQGLESEQVAKLLASCDQSTVVGRRDRAMLMLLARLGLRANEVASLELGHFDWSRGEVVIPGKGRRLERLPLPADVGESLTAYILGGRPRSNAGRLFMRVQAPRGGISAHSVKQVVTRACRRAGMKPVGTHRFRHGVATQTLAAGASLPEVGQLLRHRDLSTTAIYAKVDRNRLRDLAQPWPAGAA